MLDFQSLSAKANSIMSDNDMAYGVLEFINEDDLINSIRKTIAYIEGYNGLTPADEKDMDPYDVYHKELLNPDYRSQQIKECRQLIHDAELLKIKNKSNEMLVSYSEKPIEFTNEVQIITAMSKLRDKILSQDDGTPGLDDFLREEANKCTEIENQAKELIAAKTQAVKADTVTADVSAPQKTEPAGTISRIVITPLEKEKLGTVALASVTIDDALTINSVLIRKNQDGSGYWVQMPQKRTQDGTYIDVAHPLTAKTRINLNSRILDMYQSGNFKFLDDATANKVYNPKIKALNCEKFNNPDGRVKARMDIICSGFVVHNAKIMTTDKGIDILNLPTYLSKTGEYHSIITPKNKEAFKKLNEVALTEYNTQYKYMKATDELVAELKAAKIDFYKTTTPENNLLIKFKAADEAAVNAVINAKAQAPKLS